ncbi:hypothetical protein ElyMa_001230000 [Elysia marginata]|uniref:Uncharacterized protein n=1 Tax=Elysia marginata TaxID=1093978 RepID=A0AAV4I984_9GAST|nr:hypothetical protein ElyMa_001230000 [Elysia marginata]
MLCRWLILKWKTRLLLLAKAQRRSSFASSSSRENVGHPQHAHHTYLQQQQHPAVFGSVPSGHHNIGGALPSSGSAVRAGLSRRLKPLASLSIEDLPSGGVPGALGHYNEAGPLRSPGLLSTASMWSTSDLRQAGASVKAGAHGVAGMAFSKQGISADAASQ